MREIAFSAKAKEDLNYWKQTGNRKMQTKIQALLASIQQTPFSGIGKPEALKHTLSGLWSRRINQEHRLVYEVTDELIKVHSLKGHY
ncbi:toxin YoeB [Rhabdobacter roseus]|uniref:Putative mRNA interferase YoeB n=1 Tax=Rhabdobacter roseus TaxID=1655419 RepID=A0A840THJ3_9BACT|nr:Txe/YoeB family addiction module toxin [Rhabdobacter roseus]MBB5282934.1 toxin YoeB [Rhabdobacter roseus]